MVRGGGAIGRIHWSGLGASTAEDLHGNFSGSIGKVVDSGGGGVVGPNEGMAKGWLLECCSY